MKQHSCIIDINEDTWGFYVDIEKENNDENTCKKYEKIKYKPIHVTYDNDYYDYYYDEYDEYESKPINKNMTNLLIKVSSTTLATIGITYFLLCVL
jgi:hypothetical protein